MSDVRLSAIENQLSRMNEKFDSLIRLEVRHESLNARVDIHADRLATHSNRIGEIEKKQDRNTKSIGTFTSALSAACAALLAAVLYYIVEHI